MTARTKSALIIGSTLLVGIMLGGLGAGAIISSRVREFQGLRGSGPHPPLHDILIDVLRPVDEAQHQKIRAALDSMHARHEHLREATMRHHDAIFDTLRMELDTILTPEQKARFDEWRRKDRERRPQGPPPDGPPPPDDRRPRRGPPPDGQFPPPEERRGP